MDGIWWICLAWILVAILSFYVFFYRRSTGLKVPTIQIDDESSLSLERQQNFANDLLNWVLWGNFGTNLGMEQQLSLSPLLAQFVLNSLNEATKKIRKKPMTIDNDLQFENISRQNDADSEGIKLRSKQSMFRNFHIHPNVTPVENYLSIHTQLSYTQKSEDGGIRLDIKSLSNDDQNRRTTTLAQQDGVQMRKIPVVMSPSAVERRYTVIIDQINGDVETRLVFIAGELFVISCFRDRPTVKLRMVEKCTNSVELLSHVKRCIISAVLNFSIGELLYPDIESTERASKARLSAEYRNLSFVNEMYPTQTTPTQQKTTAPRLMTTKFPNIMEKWTSPEQMTFANRLNIQLNEIHGVNFKFNQLPFVCIEMDEPNQRFLSIKADHQSQGPGGQKVIWNEHRSNFEFAISPASNELLFEVFCEEEEQQGKLGSANTIRERKFCGTAIQSLAELRQAMQHQQRQTIELRLQGRPYAYVEQQRNRRPSQQHQQEIYGVLVVNVSLRSCPDQEAEQQPLLPPPAEFMNTVGNGVCHPPTRQPKSPSPFAYPTDQQHPPLSPIKKHSTTGSESSSTIKRALTRQKQHYIYNVTDEEGNPPSYDRQYGAGSSSSPDAYKASLSLKQFEYHHSMSNVIVEQQQLHEAQSAARRPIGAVRKTISDTNAVLFQYDPSKNDNVERKKSAPVTTTMSLIAKQQAKKITKQHSVQGEALNDNDFEHLFEKQQKVSAEQQQQQPQKSLTKQQTEKRHPAMSTFEMPDKMKRLAVGGDDPVQYEQMVIERDRKATPKKRERSFFEQVRSRLAGPVRLLPGFEGKRAKSYDENENRPMEEVVASMPNSRDQSQARQIRQHQRGKNQFETVYNHQQLFVNTGGGSNMSEEVKYLKVLFLNGGSVAIGQSMSNLTHSPKNDAFGNDRLRSQLVLELIGADEEKPRYYAIPSEVQTEPAVIKLMQSGKKLHLYEGHIFVAVKPRGRVVCAICGKKIGGNFTTRQAYQCRDCRIACHKSCHLTTSWVCTNSSIFSMNIEEVDWSEFLRHNQLKEFISSVGL